MLHIHLLRLMNTNVTKCGVACTAALRLGSGHSPCTQEDLTLQAAAASAAQKLQQLRNEAAGWEESRLQALQLLESCAAQLQPSDASGSCGTAVEASSREATEKQLEQARQAAHYALSPKALVLALLPDCSAQEGIANEWVVSSCPLNWIACRCLWVPAARPSLPDFQCLQVGHYCQSSCQWVPFGRPSWPV